MRWPAGGESFWLDELHSAWAVADDFPVISARAADGNQTTGYFHSLWFWKNTVQMLRLDQAVGLEWAMRLSSVVMNTIAGLVLLFGVTRSSGRVAGGFAAAMLLALDQHAVFFGGELRPYAAVIMCSAFATASLMKMLGSKKGSQENTPESTPSTWIVETGVARLSMVFWVCLAGLLHPTSLGTLGLLIPIGFVLLVITGRFRIWVSDVGLVAGGLITLLLLAISSLPQSWQRRDLWRAFGRATELQQLWDAWDWSVLLATPILACVLMWSLSHLLNPNQNASAEGTPNQRVCVETRWLGWLPGLIGFIATLLFFTVSYFDWVPLWHRRYFIAALPMLAWSGGEYTARAIDFATRTRWRSAHRLTAAVLVVVIGFTMYHQGILHKLAAGNLPMQLRGERWRDAVELVQQSRRSGEPVWLDSGLIEASLLSEPPEAWPSPDARFWDYLAFPLQGPYQLDGTKPVAVNAHDAWLDSLVGGLPDDKTHVWFITRSNQSSVENLVQRLNLRRPLTSNWELRSRPAVVSIEFAAK